jgi:uncharacterized protein (TIGR02246 family)
MFRFLIVTIFAVAGLVMAALAVTAPAGPVATQQKTAAPAEVVQQIESLVQRQTDLLMKKDADALAGLFVDGAVYSTSAGDILAGREKIRNYYAKTIPALGDNFTRESKVDEVHELGAAVWVLGHGKTVVRTSEGVADLKDHWIAIYEKIGGEWKVRALSLGENVALMPAKF